MTDQPESLAAALADLQQHLPRIGKDSAAIVETKTGRTYGYKYADLATISAALLPVMGRLGLSFTACPTMDNGQFVLKYRLRWAGDIGQWIGGTYPLPASTPQTIGGAITYARRYCLLAVTGAAPDEDDDDAQAAEQAARAQRNQPPEVRADGSATDAELTRMNRGHEPGAWRSTGTAENDSWNDEAGPPLDPPPETAWGSASGGQKTRMFALFGGLKMREKDKQVAFIEEVIGVQVSSRNDLSHVQAAQVIAELVARSGGKPE